MLSMNSNDALFVAVLHDVVEGTSVTIDDLSAAGFTAEIIEAVDALTRRRKESKMDAATRASKNRIALRVKLADNSDNMILSRIPSPTERDYARMVEYA